MALLSSFRAAAGAAALAALAGACDFIHPPTYVPGDPAQLLVHAVLVGGSDSAAVMVSRVGTGAGPSPVGGAQVRVTGGGGTAVLEESATGLVPCVPEVYGAPANTRAGCYAGRVPGGVRAGAEYRLEVDLPSGERVRGRTTVPASPVVHTPAARTRVPGELIGTYFRARRPLPVRWTAEGPVFLGSSVGRVWMPDAEGVRCFSYLRAVSDGTARAAADSLDVLVDLAGCNAGPTVPHVRPDSVEVMLSLTTLDSATFAYMRLDDDGIPLAEARKGLEGAFGLFGSVATTTRPVIFVPE